MSSDWQTFVCQNKRLKREFLFHAVKRKQSGINNIVWFSLVYFDKMNEAGKFLVLTDCIMT